MYNSMDEMWKDAITQVVAENSKVQSRAGGTLEVIGWSGTLLNADLNWVTNDVRCLDPHYACAEILWYLSMNPDIEMIRAYAPQYSRFANDGKAMGHYGSRWAGSKDFRELASFHLTDSVQKMNQINELVFLLQQKPETRQAVICMWRDTDLIHSLDGDWNDIPCTLSMQFILRNGQLHAIVNMRSNDIWLGMPYDVFAFTCIQRIIADQLGVKTGTYTHNVGSLHIYDKNLEQCREALKGRCEIESSHGWRPRKEGDETFAQQLKWGLEIEMHDRTNDPECNAVWTDKNIPELEPDFVRSCLPELSAVCRTKFIPALIKRVQSPVLKRAIQRRLDGKQSSKTNT